MKRYFQTFFLMMMSLVLIGLLVAQKLTGPTLTLETTSGDASVLDNYPLMTMLERQNDEGVHAFEVSGSFKQNDFKANAPFEDTYMQEWELTSYGLDQFPVIERPDAYSDIYGGEYVVVLEKNYTNNNTVTFKVYHPETGEMDVIDYPVTNGSGDFQYVVDFMVVKNDDTLTFVMQLMDSLESKSQPYAFDYDVGDRQVTERTDLVKIFTDEDGKALDFGFYAPMSTNGAKLYLRDEAKLHVIDPVSANETTIKIDKILVDDHHEMELVNFADKLYIMMHQLDEEYNLIAQKLYLYNDKDDKFEILVEDSGMGWFDVGSDKIIYRLTHDDQKSQSLIVFDLENGETVFEGQLVVSDDKYTMLN